MSFDDSQNIKPISAGPFGGPGGNNWDDGVFPTIRQLVISHGAGIDSIKIQYDVKGSSIWSDRHGGNGGTKTDTVKLDFPDEYLTMIRGHYGSFVSSDQIFVRSLTFMSNKRKYGPYGVELGTVFSFPTIDGKIVGFHGRSGLYLDAIGVYLKPMRIQTPPKAMIQSQNYVATKTESEGYSIIQGSVGQNYDIVLAVRQKDEFKKPLPVPTSISKQVSSSSSSESSDDESIVKRPVKKVPSKAENVVPCGPWGGSGGTAFDDGYYTGVRQINVSRNVGIVYIRVLYACDEESVWGSRAGGTGGFKHDKVIFDYPYEILTHVTGHYGPVMYMGPNVIKSLTFHTTKTKYGPFGEAQGTPFSTNVREGKIVGFHGRKGLFLDALGVHVVEGKVTPASRPPSSDIVPATKPFLENESTQWTKKLTPSKGGPLEEIARVVKEPAPCGPGPWGGDGGKPWDDGVFSGIKQIYLTRSLEAFCSIQIEYDRNKQSVWSVKHGGNNGTTIHRVKLDYPHEVLTCISGYYGYINKDERQQVIKSLTLHTSRGKFGPFGEEIGTFFTSTTTAGKVVGFHGRSSLYLDAIGVHMQHWLGSQRGSKPSMFKLF